MKSLKAFTLIEITIVVTILAISITLVTAWTLRTLSTAGLQASYEALNGTLRKSQSAALSSVGVSDHGLRFSTTDYTTFVGTTFAGSDPDSREVFTLPPEIEITSVSLNGATNDLVFQKGSGETGQYGTISIEHTAESQPILITISALGLID